jgi:hypothetical protein
MLAVVVDIVEEHLPAVHLLVVQAVAATAILL